MFPRERRPFERQKPFLCLRRGVSFPVSLIIDLYQLFSAYAEVFPRERRPFERQKPFLCLRRGVSFPVSLIIDLYQLFSAYAEVFLSPGRRLLD